ncbi:MAG: hypothetical protein EA351_10875 [Gemmatimonadales bacterium]|nr:MAG: hypothetical protein EA351_10875 [Gemmatimonadales bacterium]
MNEITDILRTELGRLATTLEPHGLPLIIGGGYGLLLRQEHLELSEIQTVRGIPEARSTNDLDIFLSVEILTDARKMDALRDVLHASGYLSVKGAEHYQFQKHVVYRGSQQRVKLDLLAPPPREPELLEKVKVDVRRIRNREAKGIHAHSAPEAFSIGEGVMVLELEGEGEFRVLIPHPYSFLLLKLYAYRDRRDDPAKEFGRYHAFDLYRIVAMMTEEEYETAEGFRDRFAGDEIVEEARRIVAELFADIDSRGALAILEHARTGGATIRDADLTGFLEDLRIFFPKPT